MILIIEDDEGLCELIKENLDETGHKISCVSSAGEAIKWLETQTPYLIILDYHLPDMNGQEALTVFGLRHPELPVVMLSGSANVQIMRQVLQAGAAGFVTKSCVSDELLRAVRSVLGGDIYLPAELNANHALAQQNAEDKPLLTQRQELVLRCLLDGLSNREIADQLHVAEETVKSHVAAILRQFEVQNRTQAVVIAAGQGYMPISQRQNP